jgi:hypothetical protein
MNLKGIMTYNLSLDARVCSLSRVSLGLALVGIDSGHDTPPRGAVHQALRLRPRPRTQPPPPGPERCAEAQRASAQRTAAGPEPGGTRRRLSGRVQRARSPEARLPAAVDPVSNLSVRSRRPLSVLVPWESHRRKRIISPAVDPVSARFHRPFSDLVTRFWCRGRATAGSVSSRWAKTQRRARSTDWFRASTSGACSMPVDKGRPTGR